MNVSLDYDQTYTRDKALWDSFITLLRQRGHKVYVVTMRYVNPHESEIVVSDLGSKVDGIFFTGRKAKEKFMYDKGIRIDVWIDDMPTCILYDAL